jgi:preprotein translocase subunit YajC
MKTATLLVVTLCATATAYADFSFTTTRKTQGSTATAASSTKYSFKGQKVMTESGDSATIIDFDAQTITTVNKSQKTWSKVKFSEMAQRVKGKDIDRKIDVKETGQKRVINGFNASETVMTMDVDSPQMSQAGMKMQMEIDTWRSSDVPGAQELRAFYQRNAANFPWTAIMGGGAGGTQKAMADIQRKVAASGGVPLLQTIKAKAAGGGAQAAQMQPEMAQARAQLEAVIKQGGPQAAAAQQALARMGGVASGGGSLFEMTMESSSFSTSGIPDSVFAIPAGFQKVERK